jgi:hypothetical protein
MKPAGSWDDGELASRQLGGFPACAVGAVLRSGIRRDIQHCLWDERQLV